jgi:hypothetical protein
MSGAELKLRWNAWHCRWWAKRPVGRTMKSADDAGLGPGKLGRELLGYLVCLPRESHAPVTSASARSSAERIVNLAEIPVKKPFGLTRLA